MKEFSYNFDENTQPKEIINSVLLVISELLKPYDFKYLKSKSEIIKRTEEFTFSVSTQSNRYNEKGKYAEIIIHCSICDTKNKKLYWSKTLSDSNSKINQFKFRNFYGVENYINNLNQVIEIINLHLIPFFNRFENDLQNLVIEVGKIGFCVFGSEQKYDAGFQVPMDFLNKYGTIEDMTNAFQYYIDKHELNFVRPNMKKAISLIKEGKEVINNGEKEYAEFIVEMGINLNFE